MALKSAGILQVVCRIGSLGIFAYMERVVIMVVCRIGQFRNIAAKEMLM